MQNRSRVVFQFHKGTIRTQKLLHAANPHQYFNSIKVRLELQINPEVNSNLVEFQFHKGTIRTKAAKRRANEEYNFNSIKVRLEHSDGCAEYQHR